MPKQKGNVKVNVLKHFTDNNTQSLVGRGERIVDAATAERWVFLGKADILDDDSSEDLTKAPNPFETSQASAPRIQGSVGVPLNNDTLFLEAIERNAGPIMDILQKQYDKANVTGDTATNQTEGETVDNAEDAPNETGGSGEQGEDTDVDLFRPSESGDGEIASNANTEDKSTLGSAGAVAAGEAKEDEPKEEDAGGKTEKSKEDASDLPENFPHRDILIKNGYGTVKSLRETPRETLLEIDGIGEKYLDRIQNRLANL
jgi:hypothetical protein